MDTAEIRRRFLAHFEAAGHAVVPSASLLADDPNLLFVHAGMVPFKPFFLGQETPPYDRATSIQKCVRTPDIEDVGKTTRHGTFFEMCGNFSFGDYFKEGAIELAWDLITKPVADGGYGLDETASTPPCWSATRRRSSCWMKVTGLPRERIVQLGTEGELLVDGRARSGRPVLGDPLRPRSRVRARLRRRPPSARTCPSSSRTGSSRSGTSSSCRTSLSAVRSKADFDIAGSLPKKNIDTGMGLDRVALLLQGKKNMYEIDVVYPVIAKAEELTGKTYGADHERRRPVPRGRRPRPLLDDAHRRRRHPRQRRPRLRPAPPAAPRGPVDAAARLRGPRAARADAGLPRQDGGDLRQPPHRLGRASRRWPTPRRTRSARRSRPAPRSSTSPRPR